MRKTILLSVGLFCLGTLAVAQVPTSGNIFFGYSYYNTNLSPVDRANTNGWEASLEGKIFPFVGIVADFDGHYGSENFPGGVCGLTCTPVNFNANITEHNVLFGPRVSASVGRFRPFGEALFGVGHVNASAAGSDTSWATALGGGIDYRLFHLLGLRFEGDYVQTRFFGTHQNNTRLSTGLVFHF